MSATAPVGYAIGPPFWARLALVLPDPIDQLEWSRQGHHDEAGGDFVSNRTTCSRYQAVTGAAGVAHCSLPDHRSPCRDGVTYDARLLDDGIVELRRVEFVMPTPTG